MAVQSSEGLLYLGFNSSGFRSGSNQKQWIHRLSLLLCFSFHTPPCHSLVLHSSSPLCLSAVCTFVSSFSPPPQDLLRPSNHQREMSPLTLSTTKYGCFHQVGSLLGWFCILINILCVFAWVCGLTTYYHNSGGAFAITSVCLCVLQMWSSDDLLKPKFLHELRKRASSKGWGKKETDKNRWDGKKRCVKIKRTGRVRRKNRHFGDKIMSLIEEDARRKEKAAWRNERKRIENRRNNK